MEKELRWLILKKEIDRLRDSSNVPDTLKLHDTVPVYHTMNISDTETIKILEDKIAQCKRRLAQTPTNNHELQNEVDSLNAEIVVLNKRIDSIRLDISLFPVYQTHLDTLLPYKNTCPLDAKQRIDALEINWAEFEENTASQ